MNGVADLVPRIPASPTPALAGRGAPRPAVVAALHDEARTLWPRGDDIPAALLAEVSGIGLERAARAGRLLLDRGATALLSWGTAGALEPGARPGDLVLYGAVRLRDGAEYACDATWTELLATRLAPLDPRIVTGLSSPQAVLAPAERAALHTATGAAVVDMESAALAAVAAHAGVPFAVVRCVVDPVGFSVPRAALVGLAPDGTARPARTLAMLVRRPYELPHLLRLAGWYRLALKRLSLAATRCGPDFACRP